MILKIHILRLDCIRNITIFHPMKRGEFVFYGNLFTGELLYQELVFYNTFEQTSNAKVLLPKVLTY